MTNRRRREIPVEKGSLKRGVERGEDSMDEQKTDPEAKKDSCEVPEEIQLMAIFLWTLLLNISRHLDTLKICHLLLVYA